MKKGRITWPVAVGAALVVAVSLVPLTSTEAASETIKTTSLVSRSDSGAQGSGVSEQPSVSANGRYVAFVSSASNLVPGDTNGRSDIFVRDRVTGTTQRVNLTAAGEQSTGTVGANGKGGLDLSGNGQVVAFNTDAALVSGDTNGTYDAYVRDLAAGTTERVSVSGTKSGSSASDVSINHDGAYVAYVSSQLAATSTRVDVLVHDRLSGTSEIVSRRDPTVPSTTRTGSSNFPSISDDGRYVAYSSAAADQVPDDTNSAQDVFVRDLMTNTTARVSESGSGSQAEATSVWPAISGTGRYVTFLTYADNVFPGDGNGQADYVLKDTNADTVTQVSVGNGTSGVASWTNEGRAPVSEDGRYVAFSSRGTLASPTLGLAQVYVRDTVEGTTEVVTQGSNGFSTGVSLSAEGDHIAFASGASNLIPGSPTSNRQVFLTTYQRDTTPTDTTPPIIVPTLIPGTADGDNGWYRSDVALDWHVTDPESPVQISGCVDQSITVDQPKADYACTATSPGGTTGPVTVSIGRDATAPTVTADTAPASPDGDNGWYVSPVSVEYSCTDATAGVAICPSGYISGEGTAQQAAATGSDRAGNTTHITSGPIDVDLSDPHLACEPPPTFLLGQPGSVTATVTDTTSGPVTPLTTGPVDTSSVGNASRRLTAADIAGRTAEAACGYQVHYGFSGFQSPVDQDAVNVAKAGSVVPFKWRLTDYSNNPVNGLTSVTISSVRHPCDGGAEEDPLEEVAAGASGLQNLGDGNYQLNWKSAKTYASSCRTFQLDLGEGTLRSAEFRFHN